MTVPNTPPHFQRTAFICPICNAYSAMKWSQANFWDQRGNGALTETKIFLCYCVHCEEYSYWLADRLKGDTLEGGKMIYPPRVLAPMAHPDMPEDVRKDYDEARLVATHSPRAAAAMLRLAIQRLCVNLGGTGPDLNADIAMLVSRGLPIEIQQALDVVRVVGNEAVHPGELDDSDIADVSSSLFDLVNHIVEDRISRPKKIKELFEKLPESKKDGIAKRDGG